MISQLYIEHFKSIQKLELSCKRYNLLIGDTNSGKSNILEALTLLSQNVIRSSLNGKQVGFDRRIIRYGQLNDLFPGRDVTKRIVVTWNGGGVVSEFKAGDFVFTYDPQGKPKHFSFQPAGNLIASPGGGGHESRICRFQYDPNVRYGPNWSSNLIPPDGTNLGALLMANEALADEVGAILEAKGLEVEVNPETYAPSLRHTVSKRVVVPIAFQNLSETLRRYLFLYVAIRTNKDSVLLLDEPEQNTYPFYTKHIAELMAREESNQYFITTHNQYLLQSIIEKAPKEEVQVFVTYRKDGATQTRVVPIPEVMEMMEYDLFLNLDRLTEA